METERRTRPERRNRDVGPQHGCSERRRQAERRLPSAEEATISADEFARYFGSVAAVQEGAEASAEQAAALLRRNHGSD